MMSSQIPDNATQGRHQRADAQAPPGCFLQERLLLKHKPMQTMAQHDASYRLQGRVEIDDAYRGGERAGHIDGGRKAANKTAFVAAAPTAIPCTYT